MAVGKFKWLVFAALPVLALFGNNRPFWYDEVHSIFYAKLDLHTAVEYLRSDTHAPTFFIILASWLRMVGENEFALRLLPALFYALTIVAMYLLGRSQYDEQTGFLSAFMMMVSPIAIMQSHLLRCYTMLTFLAACSLWLFLLIFRQERRTKWLFTLFVSINAIGYLMHLWFLFLIAAECLCALALYRKRLITILLFGLCLIPYCLLWLPNFLKQIANRPNGQAWLGPPGVFDLMITLIYFAGAFWLLLPTLLVKSNSNWVREWFRDPVVIICILTIFLPFTLSQFKHIFNYRYAVPALPALLLLTSRGLAMLAPYARAAACVVLLACSGWMLNAWAQNSKGCYDRDVAVYLMEQVPPSETVIYAGLQRLPIQYYLDRFDARITGFSLPAGVDRHPDYLNNYVIDKERDELIGEARAVKLDSPFWVVYGPFKAFNSVIENVLEERYEPTFSKVCDCRQVSDYSSIFGMRVVHYVPKRSIPEQASAYSGLFTPNNEAKLPK